jgi:hypothetical protein
MAKTSLNLTNVQRPAANTSPILKRRNRFCANLDSQIVKVGLFREGKRISREQFWVDGAGVVFYALKYGKQPVEIERGKSTLKATNFDDLSEQLEHLKIITIAGGLDDALSAAANATRQNFKAAKDKKAGRG